MPQPPTKSNPTAALKGFLAGALVGVIGACAMALVLCGVVPAMRKDLFTAFWQWMMAGFGLGIGVAAGFSILNGLVGYADRLKSRANL